MATLPNGPFKHSKINACFNMLVNTYTLAVKVTKQLSYFE
jgi:hypothetical protein